MIDTREKAFGERLPRADELLAQGGVDELARRRNAIESRLNGVEANSDVAALGTAEQRDQWARIQRAEQALADAPADEETEALRNRLRLVKGALYWRLAENYRASMFGQRRSLRDVDALMRETQGRWERLGRARASVPANTGEFGQRLDAARQRLEAIQSRLAAAKSRQNQYLAQIAIDELNAQKERLGAYQVQARFALAAIYDRAAAPAAPAGGGSAAPDAGGDAAPPAEAAGGGTP
jgi:chromosome segregation ATPase